MASTNNRFNLFIPTKEPQGENWRVLERWGNQGGLPSFVGGIVRTYAVGGGSAGFITDIGQIKYLLQTESYTHDPDVNGDSTIPFPFPFPNGVISIFCTNGDAVPVAATYHVRAVTLTDFIVNIYDVGGAAPYVTVTRTNYLAIGW